MATAVTGQRTQKEWQAWGHDAVRFYMLNLRVPETLKHQCSEGSLEGLETERGRKGERRFQVIYTDFTDKSLITN